MPKPAVDFDVTRGQLRGFYEPEPAWEADGRQAQEWRNDPCYIVPIHGWVHHESGGCPPHSVASLSSHLGHIGTESSIDRDKVRGDGVTSHFDKN